LPLAKPIALSEKILIFLGYLAIPPFNFRLPPTHFNPGFSSYTLSKKLHCTRNEVSLATWQGDRLCKIPTQQALIYEELDCLGHVV
jgi:hypothetical protein